MPLPSGTTLGPYALVLFVSMAFAVVPVSAQPGDETLEGVIDFHAHAGPDSRPRSLTDIEVARLFRQAGLRGVVLKNHFTMTADRAALAMAQVEGLEIFGGVALNLAVGGINPEAVAKGWHSLAVGERSSGCQRSMRSFTSPGPAGPARSSE